MIIFKVIIFFFIKIINSQLCGIIVPDNILTSDGLLSPFILKSLNNPYDCTVLNKFKTVFVEVTILDIINKKFYIYNPIVIDFEKPEQISNETEKPIIPDNSIIGIWFGSNNVTFKLLNSTYNSSSIINGNCIDGINGSIFGNFAYCNAESFFSVTNRLISTRNLQIPSIKNNINNIKCLSTRSYAFMNQYEISQISSSYLVSYQYKIYQNTLLNINLYNITINNFSNNNLLTNFLNPSLGCNPFTGTDILQPINTKTSLALNELHANTIDIQDQAFIPSEHPSVLVNGNPNLQKLNAYRKGLNQKISYFLDNTENMYYCEKIYKESINYLYKNYKELNNFDSPDKNIASNLINFLALRFINTWNILNCKKNTNKDSPIIITLNMNGVVSGNNILDVYIELNNSNNNSNTNIIYYLLIFVIFVIFMIVFIIIINIEKKKSLNQKKILNEINKQHEYDCLQINKKHIENQQKLMNIINIQNSKRIENILNLSSEI